MNIEPLDQQVSISGQIQLEDLTTLRAMAVEVVVCNRPDGESADQVPFTELAERARALGINAVHLPFTGGDLPQATVDAFRGLMRDGKRMHAYCRTGNRSRNLYLLACGREVKKSSAPAPLADANGLAEVSGKRSFDVVIVGGGSGGIAVAASLRRRQRALRIAIVDPAADHFYQPGWTLVGGGVFDVATTRVSMREVIPRGVHWIKQKVVGFEPGHNLVNLAGGEQLGYQQLVVAPGLTLAWDQIEGLAETLGANGVTSNYRFDLAPYTWQLVTELERGRAVFTQPAMPIKCAGAPQKALYLSADHWRRQGVLKAIDLHFYNAGAVLFGVAAYLPALQSYMDRYGARLHFKHRLIKVDGPARLAVFESVDEQGQGAQVQTEFDMLHVCPPQVAPDFIRHSSLADAAGWLEVDPVTLQHARFANIWGVGDVLNTTNAKTMAAVRKQAPVVAHNICNLLAGREIDAGYDGYGSCPLTVARGKIVLAEFGYGGKLMPTFPSWVNESTRATRFAWFLKADLLPRIYWHGMLKGREWLAKPQPVNEVKIQ